MNLEIRGIHYTISDTTREFFDKKLERIHFATDNIVDLSIVVHKEPHGYNIEAKIHFQWGVTKLVSSEAFELYEAIEFLVDKMEHVIRKEKDKIKDHSGHAHVDLI